MLTPLVTTIQRRRPKTDFCQPLQNMREPHDGTVWHFSPSRDVYTLRRQGGRPRSDLRLISCRSRSNWAVDGLCSFLGTAEHHAIFSKSVNAYCWWPRRNSLAVASSGPSELA